MEYNTLPTSGLNQFWGSVAQECTHMNDTAFFLCPDQKKKKKRGGKIDLIPTLPIFRPKGQTNLLFFLGLSI